MKIFSIYLFAFVLAASSIMYELIIAYTISGIAAGSVIWYSLTIGLYLLFMGIGAFFAERVRGKRSILHTLFYVEITLVIIGGLAVILLHFAHMLHVFFLVQNMNLISGAVLPITAVTLISSIGFLTGIELPLLLEWGSKITKKAVTNRILTSDYTGSLIGALLIPIIIIPVFSNVHAGFITAIINLFAAIAILFFFIGFNDIKKAVIIGVLTSALFISLFYASAIEYYFMQKYYFYQDAQISLNAFLNPSPTPDIIRVSSPYQRIDFFQTPDSSYRLILNRVYSTKWKEDPAYPVGYHLFINGDFQILSNTDEIYHEWFAHYPIIANGFVPKSVLVLGGGDGMLNKELLKYRGIEKITHVELDSEMIELARTNPVLSHMNRDSLDDPRVKVIIGDAYTYVKNTNETYDAIYIDFPFAQDYNLARLYSGEFYSFTMKRLSENGFIVFDAPDADLYTNFDTGEILHLGDSWFNFYHTLKSAGFNFIHPYASIIESENAEAFAALDELDLPVVNPKGFPVLASPEKIEEYEHDSIRKAIRIYAAAANQPFILAKKNSALPNKWVNNNVKLHILNEKRFNLSKDLPYPTPETLDISRVNSIMRPVFNFGITWQLRRPY